MFKGESYFIVNRGFKQLPIGFLHDKANFAGYVRDFHVRRIMPPQQNIPLRGTRQAADSFQHGGLTGAVLPDNRRQLMFHKGKTYIV